MRMRSTSCSEATLVRRAEVAQVAVVPAARTFLYDGVGQALLEALEVDKPQVHVRAGDGGEVQGPIDAGRVHTRALEAGLVHVELRAVEAPEVVDDPDHELQRIVHFQVQALERLDRKRRECALQKEYPAKDSIWRQTSRLTPGSCPRSSQPA